CGLRLACAPSNPAHAQGCLVTSSGNLHVGGLCWGHDEGTLMATIPGRWACRLDLEDCFVAVVLALAFIPSWRRDDGGERRRSVGRLNNNGPAAEDEAAARDCRAAR